MSSVLAAKTIASNLSFDFASKSVASAASSFASKLNDAQRPTPAPEPKSAADVEKPKPKLTAKRRVADESDEDAADSPSDAASATDRATSAAEATDPADVDEAAETDEAQDARAAKAKPKDDDAASPTVADTAAADALTASVAASVPVANAVEKIVDPKQASDGSASPDAAKQIAPTAALAALSDQVAVAQNGKPADAKSKQADVTTNASEKPSDGKADALAAKLKPADAAELPPDAGAQHAAGHDAKQQHGQQPSDGDGQQNAASVPVDDAAAKTTEKPSVDKEKTFDDLLSKLAPDVGAVQDQSGKTTTATASPQPAVRPEQQFARDNVDKVVTSVQSQVAAGGNGAMHVRLDPPELGALEVAVKMNDGRMTASFTTSNEQATQLLSHNLGHLKTSLESAGITVDRIDVRQSTAPTGSSASAGDRDSSGQQDAQDRGFQSSSQQQGEQQRKQMVDRLWRKYAYGSDEVDLVA